MRGEPEVAATRLTIIISGALFILKLLAAIVSGSVAVIADSINSLLHMVRSLMLRHVVRESHDRAEKGHHFPQAHAEPMIGILLAVVTGIIGFELLRSALLNTSVLMVTRPVLIILITAIIAELLLSDHLRRIGEKLNNPGIRAAAGETRNDLFITLLALTGLVFASALPLLDNLVGIIIGIWIMFRALREAREHISYVVGTRPSPELERKIREAITGIRGVRGIEFMKAHTLGHYTHLEIHLRLQPRISTRTAQVIAMTAQHDLDFLPEISKTFVAVESL